MTSTIYVITYHYFNHAGRRFVPLDERFLKSDQKYVYYLIDETLPEPLKGKEVLFEKEIDPLLHKAGGKFFAEWSFLLAEAKYSFCRYPLFMISSRFYEKNQWLKTDLNREWERLFGYFDTYSWGYLPSYDRPLRWIDLSWDKYMSSHFQKHFFFPFSKETFELTHALFDVRIPEEYHFASDLYCNYIGFRDREALLSYVLFYQPLIDFFFTDQYEMKCDLSKYVKGMGCFSNEKPFTFLLEYLSHLFFFKKKEPLFALHYDGYYEIREDKKALRKLYSFHTPLSLKMNRAIDWQRRRLQTESSLAPSVRLLKRILKRAKT